MQAPTVITHTYPSDSASWQDYLSPAHHGGEKNNSPNVLDNYQVEKY